MLVPDAMSTEADLVPVLDMVPLDFLPPLSLPSEADLLQLLHGHGQSPQPCKIKNRKARCYEERRLRKRRREMCPSQNEGIYVNFCQTLSGHRTP